MRKKLLLCFILSLFVINPYTYSENQNVSSEYKKARQLYLSYNIDDVKKSVKIYKDALKINSEDILSYTGLIDSLIFLGNFDKLNGLSGETHFKTAIALAELLNRKTNDNVAEVHRSLGNLCLNINYKEKANKHLKKALSLSPDDSETNYLLWSLNSPYEENHNLEKALQKNPQLICALNDLGYLYVTKKNLSEAHKIFDYLLTIAPKNEIVLNNMGIVYMKMNNIDKAIDCFEKATIINRDFYLPHKNLGDIYFRQNELDNSLKFYSSALEINEKSHIALLNIGIIHYTKGNFEEAIHYLKRSNSIKENTDALNALGFVYYDKKDYKNCYYYWIKALQNSENNPDVLAGLSVYYYSMQKKDSSLLYFGKAVHISKTYLERKKLKEQNYWSENILKDYDRVLAYYKDKEKENQEDDFENLGSN